MGSKSKSIIMKSYENLQKEARLHKTKKENAPDIISKSILKNMNVNCLKGSGRILINL